MRRILEGLILFTGLFLMCCDSVPVVLAGLACIGTSAYLGKALPGQKRKPRAWRH